MLLTLFSLSAEFAAQAKEYPKNSSAYLCSDIPIAPELVQQKLSSRSCHPEAPGYAVCMTRRQTEVDAQLIAYCGTLHCHRTLPCAVSEYFDAQGHLYNSKPEFCTMGDVYYRGFTTATRPDPIHPTHKLAFLYPEHAICSATCPVADVIKSRKYLGKLIDIGVRTYKDSDKGIASDVLRESFSGSMANGVFMKVPPEGYQAAPAR